MGGGERRFGGNSQQGLIEIRTYDAFPERTKEYHDLASESADLRVKHTGDCWKLFLSAETGYGSLNEFVHLYSYESMVHRANVRKSMGADSGWARFLGASKPCLSSQKSEIFVPARLPGLTYFTLPSSDSPEAVYEIRH